MKKYKNISEQELSIPEIGTIQPGGIVEAEDINNANFEEVVEKETKTK